MESTQSDSIHLGHLERLVSIGMGMGLLCGMVRLKGFSRFATLLTAGGYLLYRGISGNCPVSGYLNLKGGCCTRDNDLVIRQNILVKRPRNETYGAWRQLEHLPRMMKHLRSVESPDDIHSRWTAGFPESESHISWEAEITREEAGKFLAWQSAPGSMIENAGEVMFSDAPGVQGTEVEVAVTCCLPPGRMGKGIVRVFQPVAEDLLRVNLLHFKRSLEEGRKTPEVPDTLES